MWEASRRTLIKTATSLHVNPRHVIAELVGMTLFVFIGTGAAVFFSNPKTTDYIDVTGEGTTNQIVAAVYDNLTINASFGIVTALAFGMAIMVAAFSIGHVSGCHLNPAVTVSLVLSGNCGLGQGVANMIAQFAGATLGSLLLWGTSSMRDGGLGANSIGDSFTVGNAILGEIVMTFVLGHAVLIPLDGCSINPARSFGPALVANKWTDYWVFVVGPLAGAVLSVPFFYLVSQPWEAKRDAKGQVVLEETEGMKITSEV
ncbi:hypothetical protein CHLNCDRAFT_145499 [Chlorella variabilis]|uniref:Aquaporin n=1 Tax=Chlorella variabilis TaxID=554065 RepID=E1ZDM2_CHLVA|nr:hypothetical protein CHLNCDRAFT_145499 [Chlorella variabilis]EFN56049.1 hypothetical protein CHLNCDRAFT_145499 [Chlorella variabilis]|eukprot:XP_005848151.1 hypothetical protein CHLNCDRAFT_145499 [Chlorella variabilis]